MRREIKGVFVLFLLLTSVVLLQGCVYFVIGSIGAVGGYVVSPDTVEGTMERDLDEVWQASFEVANIMGNIVRQNEKAGTLEAIINNSRVNIDIARFSSEMVRLKVKARKAFFPNITTAQDVYVKIVNQINR